MYASRCNNKQIEPRIREKVKFYGHVNDRKNVSKKLQMETIKENDKLWDDAYFTINLAGLKGQLRCW